MDDHLRDKSSAQLFDVDDELVLGSKGGMDLPLSAEEEQDCHVESVNLEQVKVHQLQHVGADSGKGGTRAGAIQDMEGSNPDRTSDEFDSRDTEESLSTSLVSSREQSVSGAVVSSDDSDGLNDGDCGQKQQQQAAPDGRIVETTERDTNKSFSVSFSFSWQPYSSPPPKPTNGSKNVHFSPSPEHFHFYHDDSSSAATSSHGKFSTAEEEAEYQRLRQSDWLDDVSSLQLTDLRCRKEVHFDLGSTTFHYSPMLTQDDDFASLWYSGQDVSKACAEISGALEFLVDLPQQEHEPGFFSSLLGWKRTHRGPDPIDCMQEAFRTACRARTESAMTKASALIHKEALEAVYEHEERARGAVVSGLETLLIRPIRGKPSGLTRFVLDHATFLHERSLNCRKKNFERVEESDTADEKKEEEQEQTSKICVDDERNFDGGRPGDEGTTGQTRNSSSVMDILAELLDTEESRDCNTDGECHSNSTTDDDIEGHIQRRKDDERRGQTMAHVSLCISRPSRLFAQEVANALAASLNSFTS